MTYTTSQLDASTFYLFEQCGFTRRRQVGEHTWTVSKVVEPA